MNATLAICAIVKNEHDYLLEWMAYHRLVGVDHFLIYNNSGDNDDGTTKLLSKLQQSGLAEVVPWPDREEWRLPAGVYLRPQLPAYYDGLQRIRGRYTWLAFVDVDEYIVPMQERDLPSALERYEQFGGVAANWRTFGTSGLRKKEDAPVCQRFTMAATRQNRVNQHVKCIARADLICELGIHRPFLKGGVLVDEHGREVRNSSGFRYPVSYDILRINHYYTKSWDEWSMKVARGRASHPKKREQNSISETSFNDERDTFIFKFYPGIIDGMKELGQAANIADDPFLNRTEGRSYASGEGLQNVTSPGEKRRETSSHHQAALVQTNTPQEGPILDVHLLGGFANRMMQYLVGQRVAKEVEDCRLSNAILPDWGIHEELLPGPLGPEIHPRKSEQRAGLARIVEILRSREVPRVTFRPDVCWLSNFPDLETSRNLFPQNLGDYPGFGSEYLVCDLRGSEISDGAQMHHVILPIDFYGELAQTTGLKLAFIGMTANNAYTRALQQRFPEAIFQTSRGDFADFQTFRNSKNLVVAVNSFSWLAAWLSNASFIHLPVDGIFHPRQEPNVDLLPIGDSRYQFYLFPINYAVPVDRFEQVHRNLDWHPVSPDVISTLRTPSHPRRLEAFVPLFDEAFYSKTYQDVANAVRTGGLQSCLDHYIKRGFQEGRNGFAFDQLWYSTAYPQAAREVGQGQYSDLLHHYVEAGAMRGYKPMPDVTK